MSQRLRLFVKKRGTRRTGTRGWARSARSVLDVALLVIGVAGLYWLFAGVLFDDDRPHGWWPWLVMIIPAALVIYGGAGLIALAWKNMASTERRAAAVQKATDWELLGTAADQRPTLVPNVPPFDVVTDSAGVKLAYRLPIDAASGWLSFAMAAICLAWNTLVGIFVFQLIRQHAAGEPNWLLTWLMVPFVLAGIGTLIALGRQVLFTAGIGTTRLEISAHPLFSGAQYEGHVWQSGRLHVRWFQVQLLCEEQAIYPQGTDTRTATVTVYRHTLLGERKFDITPRQAFEADFTSPCQRPRCIRLPLRTMRSPGRSSSAAGWPAGRSSNAAFPCMSIQRRSPIGSPITPRHRFRKLSRHEPASRTTDARQPDAALSAGRQAGGPIPGRFHPALADSRGRIVGVVVHGRQGR